MQLDEQIAHGTEVLVSYPRGEFSAEVRYCVFREIGYFIGLAFRPGSKWSKDDYRPMHLLDPRTLMRNRRAQRGDDPATLPLQ